MACCVIGCKNRFQCRGELHFYRIPKPKTPFHEDRREKWIQAIRRPNWSEKTISNSRICSQHFITGTFSLDPNHPDFVPSIFSFTRHRDLQKGLKKLDRFNRRVKLTESTGVPYVPDTPSYSPEQITLFAQNTNFNWPSLQTEMTSPENIAYITKVVEEIHGLKRGDIISFEFEPSRPPPITQDTLSDSDHPEVHLPEGHSHKDHTYGSPSKHQLTVETSGTAQTSEKPSTPSAADKKKKLPKKKPDKVTKNPPNSSEMENLPAAHLQSVSKDHTYAELLERTAPIWTSCHICDRSFLGLTLLQEHLQVHLEEKQHICPICDKRFSSAAGVFKHEKMHSKEKSFSCSLCSKKFKRKGTLHVHLTTHSGKHVK